MTLTTRFIVLCAMLAAAVAAKAQQPEGDGGNEAAADSTELRVERALARSGAIAAEAVMRDSTADTTAMQPRQATVTDDSLTMRVRLAEAAADSITMSIGETLAAADSTAALDSAALSQLWLDDLPKEKKREKRDWDTWRPNPQRALWLALVIPGGGQIYNRKYWKLPIVYGGFMGCLYALNWNNMMYKDYSQAYLDIMDDDPTTQSYNNFMHLGRTIDSSNEDRYKEIFRSRKDRYRRWRDLSFFCLLGVYALSVIDAYVDAELSEFDISKDLSLRVEPAVMTAGQSSKVLEAASFGIQCQLRF